MVSLHEWEIVRMLVMSSQREYGLDSGEQGETQAITFTFSTTHQSPSPTEAQIMLFSGQMGTLNAC